MGAEHCWNNAGQRVVVVIVIVIALMLSFCSCCKGIKLFLTEQWGGAMNAQKGKLTIFRTQHSVISLNTPPDALHTWAAQTIPPPSYPS